MAFRATEAMGWARPPCAKAGAGDGVIDDDCVALQLGLRRERAAGVQQWGEQAGACQRCGRLSSSLCRLANFTQSGDGGGVHVVLTDDCARKEPGTVGRAVCRLWVWSHRSPKNLFFDGPLYVCGAPRILLH